MPKLKHIFGQLVLTLALIACQSSSAPPDNPAAVVPLAQTTWLATTVPTSQPVGPSSVMVYIKTVIEKKYSLLAYLVGQRNVTIRHTVYDVNHSWWDNPLIAYADAPLAQADVVGQADAEALTGQGNGDNISVKLTLVPHALVAVRTVPACDGLKGTITVSISTVADFFDGEWREMLRTTDRQLRFSFDTCDPHKQLHQVVHETRTIPAFSLERYTRGHVKWEPKTAWPDKPSSGDGRTVIYGKNAMLDVTGYRYVER